MTLLARFIAVAAAFVALALPAQAAEKLAVFDFQLANLGQLPPTPEDRARLPRISDLLRQQLSTVGKDKFEVVPITDKVRGEVKQSAELRACGGCAADFAKQLGADYAVTGEVQKVSDLILNINVYFQKVGSTEKEHAYTVDIRGDNDLSFDHGVKYLVKHNILKQ